MEKKKISENKSFIKGLEGLRAISVLGVILFHLWPNIFAGGFSGVTVFFVISGFLMTRIILKGFKNGTFSFWDFYKRRFWRLYPAFFIMLLSATGIVSLFFPDALFGIRGNFFSNIFYVNNWYQIIHSVSYFAAGNHWEIFTHLWSLSVEAQFYLLWPLLLFAILKLADRKWQLSLVIPAVIFFVSSLLFALLYSPVSTNRAYYGTDSRIFSFVAGAFVAIYMTLVSFRGHPKFFDDINSFLDKYKNQIIVACFAVLLLVFVFANGTQAWAYYFAMSFLSLAVAVLVYYFSVYRNNIFARIMGNRFCLYLGSRSYSIYLYQLPILVIFDQLASRQSAFLQFLARIVSLALILLVSELSFRFVEMPLRHGISPIKSNFGPNFKTYLFSGITFVFAISSIFGMSSRSADHLRSADQLQHNLSKKSVSIKRANSKAAASQSRADSINNASEISQDKQKADTFSTSIKTVAAVKGMKITAIGDSVLMDVGPDLQSVIPGTTVDAAVGRHTQQAIDRLDQIKRNGDLQPIVLIVIGINGEISSQNIQQVLNIAGKRQIYWVNSYAAGRPWEAPNNQLLLQKSQNNSNLHIIDWNTGARQHPEWFFPDGIHPQAVGNKAMTNLIMNALARNEHYIAGKK